MRRGAKRQEAYIFLYLEKCYIRIYIKIYINIYTLKKPNIILLITDDQDVMMKSEDVMQRTRRLIIGKKAKRTNFSKKNFQKQIFQKKNFKKVKAL